MGSTNMYNIKNVEVYAPAQRQRRGAQLWLQSAASDLSDSESDSEDDLGDWCSMMAELPTIELPSAPSPESKAASNWCSDEFSEWYCGGLTPSSKRSARYSKNQESTNTTHEAFWLMRPELGHPDTHTEGCLSPMNRKESPKTVTLSAQHADDRTEVFRKEGQFRYPVMHRSTSGTVYVAHMATDWVSTPHVQQFH